MKRKFKLFATVASLCLCLALMAFGVYAATSVTYTASGTVSYEVKDVFVDFQLKIEQVAQPADHSVGYVSTQQGAVEDLVFTANTLDEDAEATYAKQSSYTIVNEKKAALDATAAAALKDADIALDFNKASAYRITITVTSQEETKTLNINEVVTGSGLTNAWIAAQTKATNAKTVDAKGSVNLVYYVVLEDASMASSGAWSIALTVTK